MVTFNFKIFDDTVEGTPVVRMTFTHDVQPFVEGTEPTITEAMKAAVWLIEAFKSQRTI